MKGANCVTELDKKVTHVVARDRLTQKVKDALNMHIPVVHVNWLYECMNHFRRVDTTHFERNLKDFKEVAPSMVLCCVKTMKTKKITLEHMLHGASYLLWFFSPLAFQFKCKGDYCVKKTRLLCNFHFSDLKKGGKNNNRNI
ncbi:hypothetical protein RFI_23035 [Reticulomyxa filosa]|uniref:BRCT domain-containing protein n=1 Tax=Reticulomyxa filosa TaxID=46433 RepID=X6MJZ6_RETFI|nr:hypothetical protein RFI_23035 [Reticulomyxa filosa]|eukprot:ETO14333.1 hypothetical protein RFI_23035 [Reticulomyxa filosa]